MNEPYKTQFIELLRSGASTRDIFDSEGRGGYDSEPTAPTAHENVLRELQRVDAHSSHLCRTLVDHIPSAARVLDVGCGTGGTTIALALCDLNVQEIVGIDANPRVLEAARVRALGYDLDTSRARFVHVPAGSSLPFESDSFDLLTCVSVLEFVTNEAARMRFTQEMARVVRPGGYVFLATPTPFALREIHSRRLLGNWLRRAGMPWASTPFAVRRMFKGFEFIPLQRYRMKNHPTLKHLHWSAPAAKWFFPWQQYLMRKPAAP